METEWTERERKEREAREARKTEADKTMWTGIRNRLIDAGCPIRATVVDEWFEERIGKSL